MNQFELNRSDEGVPFNFSIEHWALLNAVESENISKLRKEFDTLSETEKDENRDEMNNFLTSTKTELAFVTEQDFYIAANLKFIDEGAYNFLHCEHCGAAVDFYVVSV